MSENFIRRRSIVVGAAFLPAVGAILGPVGRTSSAAAARRPLTATFRRDTVVDPAAIFFLSYDGLVNNGSFQQSGILTYRDRQYAAWYTADRHAMVARRRLDPGREHHWEAIELPHLLTTDDSHNTISLGISRADGRLHIAMDTHNTQVFYTTSAAGLVDGRLPWSADSFGPMLRTLNGVDLGGISYPQFIGMPSGGLLLSYRTGGSGDGVCELAEYLPSQWTRLGAWTSARGDFHANGTVSSTRNMYLHGIGYDHRQRLHAAFTWRETAAAGAILCNPGGLSNHDTGYVYSDDHGRSWRTQDGVRAAITGSDQQVSINTPRHIVDPLPIDQALINQESQAVDRHGQPHVVISYVPESVTTCVTNFVAQRRESARVFHLHRDRRGDWHKVELPEPLRSFGRSRLILTPDDDAYVVLPGGRILAATAASNWSDWHLVYDGSDLNAFGEVLVDESRIAVDRVLSIFYQEPGKGTTQTPIHVADFSLSRRR